STLTTEINLPFITADKSGPKHLTKTINRAKLEDLVKSIVEKTEGPIKQAVSDAKLTTKDIDKIIMVGGPTRMPMVQKTVEDFVGTKIERGIDPMECVSMGAAIQGSIITGETKDVLLLDVTPLSLGLETLGGVFTKLIPRNTTIPTKKSQIFSTAEDNQTAVTIRVLQGEREMAKGNTELGRFDLVGIPPAPRGVPQIEVTFDIDSNGIVHVHAKDKGTGKEQSIRITAPQKLSDEDIDKMVKEAEEHAEEDKKQKELIEVKNKADSVVYTTEKSLKDYGDKISDQEKKTIEEKINNLKEILKKSESSKEEIEKAMEEATQASHKLAEQMYKAQAAQQQKQPGSGEAEQAGQQGAEKQEQGDQSEGKKEEDVVDAEYKEEDNK
ncbi:MAG: Hsp70 family protein, partial [Candidatus Omnitrophica bacterium]|nr:Hsp70 family protein [Candidatus Omnitrophota bacterium]